MDKQTKVSEAESAIALRRARSLADIVRQELERMIGAGELRAGERVNEQALATRLGVSRGPVREACRSLERLGLVTTVLNQGTFVRVVDEREAEEIFDLRMLLFGFACMRLATIIQPKQVRALEALVSRMHEAVNSGDADAYYDLNIEFHATIMSFCDNQRVRQSYQMLVNELNLVRRRTLHSLDRVHESLTEHEALLTAIRNGDAADARRLAESHIGGGKRRWGELRREDKSL
jgi:DNA-binding GntR family transcriptional regulator